VEMGYELCIHVCFDSGKFEQKMNGLEGISCQLSCFDQKALND
jgi:hypothetical protein